MRIAREDIPARINVPGAVARQTEAFGDATGFGASPASGSRSAPAPTSSRC